MLGGLRKLDGRSQRIPPLCSIYFKSRVSLDLVNMFGPEPEPFRDNPRASSRKICINLVDLMEAIELVSRIALLTEAGRRCERLASAFFCFVCFTFSSRKVYRNVRRIFVHNEWQSIIPGIFMHRSVIYPGSALFGLMHLFIYIYLYIGDCIRNEHVTRSPLEMFNASSTICSSWLVPLSP